MYQRDAKKTLLNLAGSYPVVAVTGPRQSGKTTLTKSVFNKKLYISLEDLDQQNFARKDPRAFLMQSKTGLLIDEIQNVPELFSYIQGIVDRLKKPGHFIITGSQQFGLLSKISQSLAGRVGFIELLPLSISETKKTLKTLDETLYKGFYPALHNKSFKLPPHLWYEDYVKTYLEKDLRQLINIKDLSLFQKFLRLCAGRNGQLVNCSELSNVTGINIRTVQSWLSILEASYIIFLLKPYHKNFSKKLIKTAKLYFYDPGLLCYLLHLRSKDVFLSPYKGSIFESMIISEYFKYNNNNRLGLNFYFWRDNKGVEIDLLFQKNRACFNIEIKSGETINDRFFKNLKLYQKYSNEKNKPSFLIYGGTLKQKRKECTILPWKQTICC